MRYIWILLIYFPSVEYTRVQLHKIEGVEGSEYINANYVQVRRRHTHTHTHTHRLTDKHRHTETKRLTGSDFGCYQC